MRSPALLLSSLQNFVSGSIEREEHACDAESFSRRRVTELWNCAALYVALGLIGIFFLTSEPGIATSSEGYGIAATASPTPLR